MKKKISVVLSVLLCLSILFSSVTAFAGSYFDNGEVVLPEIVTDEVAYIISQNLENPYGHSIISCDNDNNIYMLSWPTYDAGLRNIYEFDGSDLVRFRMMGYFYKWNYNTQEWDQYADTSNFTTNYFYGPDFISGQLSEIAAENNVTGSFIFAGSNIVWYHTNDSVIQMFEEVFPLPILQNYFDWLKQIASTFISAFIKPFIDVIVAEPILFVICLFGVVVSIVSFVYLFFVSLSSKRGKKALRRKKRG